MKWVIVGASNIAKEWVCDAIRSCDDELVSVVSGDLVRGECFARQLSIAHYTDNLHEALALSGVDAVYISSQNHLHCEQALLALKQGKAVMCEKPVALNVDDARKMIECARLENKLLAVNHHLRNASTIKKIRQLIAQGSVGEVLTVSFCHAVYLPKSLQSWRINDRHGGGVILDITVHDADTLRFILQDDPVLVSAMSQAGSMSVDNIPETVMGVMKFQRGTLVNFYDSFNAKYNKTSITIIGSVGTIRAENVLTQQPAGEIYLMNEQGCEEIKVIHENLYVNSFHCFKQALLTHSQPAASAQDGLWSLKIAQAVAESVKQQKAILIDKE